MKEKEFLPLVQSRLGIKELNKMQRQMMENASSHRTTMLLSPTGSGKTLAFLLPILKMLKPASGRVQVVIIAPSRELVLQIFNVTREIARGYKITALYGGHNVPDEINSLQAGTDIIIATPGRLLDHIRRRNIDVMPSRILVFDEFDKTLELGFQDEISHICRHMKNISRLMLTSATGMTEIPAFVPANNDIQTFDFLIENQKLKQRLKIHRVISEEKDKLEALLQLLYHITTNKREKLSRCIIFVSHRESAERIFKFLESKKADAILYHGALDQQQREKAVARFNNGSAPIMVATDLAARGLDIEMVTDIIHYHLPGSYETYTHRNGRTARVEATGDVYLLTGPEENMPPFIKEDDTINDFSKKDNDCLHLISDTSTLHISAGRKEKLSRGDVAGFLIRIGKLEPSEVGNIDVRDHYTLVAIPKCKTKEVMRKIDREKIKGEKRKFSLM